VPPASFSNSRESHNQDEVSMGTIATRDEALVCPWLTEAEEQCNEETKVIQICGSVHACQEGEESMTGRLIIQDRPELVAPYIIIGLKGWLNAGEVSTGSVDYLRRKLNARPFATIEPRGFYIYQIPSATAEQTMRPQVKIREGVIKKLELPRNEFFFWKSGGAHDLILLLGVEPNLDWPQYAQAILDVACQFRATRIYSIGGIFDQVPHTRKTRILATISHSRLKEELKTFARFTDYEGPSSFNTMLISIAREQGIEMAGISAITPLYIQDLNAKACYDLLQNVTVSAGFGIDLSNLREAGETLVEMMDRAFSQNATALEQLKKLEEQFDAAIGQEPLQGPGEDYDKLLAEMRRLKMEGRKPH
jgi:proteasome assembly chaperone (PAC2) family protein